MNCDNRRSVQVFGSVVGGLDTLAQAELISCGPKDVSFPSALCYCRFLLLIPPRLQVPLTDIIIQSNTRPTQHIYTKYLLFIAK
jgi:hypothetical protein